jgi:hypothetical protein
VSYTEGFWRGVDADMDARIGIAYGLDGIRGFEDGRRIKQELGL